MPAQPNKIRVKLLLTVQQDRCFYCERKISFDPSTGWLKATVDHFHPIGRGGAKGISNVVMACEVCNGRKGDNLPRLDEFLKWNNLAAVWPYIKPFDLKDLVPIKICRCCGRPIAVVRLLAARRALTQVQTCSKRCSRKKKKKRGGSSPAPSTGTAYLIDDAAPCICSDVGFVQPTDSRSSY